jgi:hypothetical protein
MRSIAEVRAHWYTTLARTEAALCKKVAQKRQKKQQKAEDAKKVESDSLSSSHVHVPTPASMPAPLPEPTIANFQRILAMKDWNREEIRRMTSRQQNLFRHQAIVAAAETPGVVKLTKAQKIAASPRRQAKAKEVADHKEQRQVIREQAAEYKKLISNSLTVAVKRRAEFDQAMEVTKAEIQKLIPSDGSWPCDENGERLQLHNPKLMVRWKYWLENGELPPTSPTKRRGSANQVASPTDEKTSSRPTSASKRPISANKASSSSSKGTPPHVKPWNSSTSTAARPNTARPTSAKKSKQAPPATRASAILAESDALEEDSKGFTEKLIERVCCPVSSDASFSESNKTEKSDISSCSLSAASAQLPQRTYFNISLFSDFLFSSPTQEAAEILPRIDLARVVDGQAMLAHVLRCVRRAEKGPPTARLFQIKTIQNALQENLLLREKDGEPFPLTKHSLTELFSPYLTIGAVHDLSFHAWMIEHFLTLPTFCTEVLHGSFGSASPLLDFMCEKWWPACHAGAMDHDHHQSKLSIVHSFIRGGAAVDRLFYTILPRWIGFRYTELVVGFLSGLSPSHLAQLDLTRPIDAGADGWSTRSDGREFSLLELSQKVVEMTTRTDDRQHTKLEFTSECLLGSDLASSTSTTEMPRKLVKVKDTAAVIQRSTLFKIRLWQQQQNEKSASSAIPSSPAPSIDITAWLAELNRDLPARLFSTRLSRCFNTLSATYHLGTVQALVSSMASLPPSEQARYLLDPLELAFSPDCMLQFRPEFLPSALGSREYTVWNATCYYGRTDGRHLEARFVVRECLYMHEMREEMRKRNAMQPLIDALRRALDQADAEEAESAATSAASSSSSSSSFSAPVPFCSTVRTLTRFEFFITYFGQGIHTTKMLSVLASGLCELLDVLMKNHPPCIASLAEVASWPISQNPHHTDSHPGERLLSRFMVIVALTGEDNPAREDPRPMISGVMTTLDRHLATQQNMLTHCARMILLWKQSNLDFWMTTKWGGGLFDASDLYLHVLSHAKDPSESVYNQPSQFGEELVHQCLRLAKQEYSRSSGAVNHALHACTPLPQDVISFLMTPYCWAPDVLPKDLVAGAAARSRMVGTVQRTRGRSG